MQLSSIDLNLLVVLDALLETESVKEAAKRLALSPSATSHALGRLRDLLGDPVLVRAGRRMVRSARGERLRPRVRALTSELAGLLRQEAFDPATCRDSFRIGSTDYAELFVVAPLSRRLQELAPGIDLRSVAEGVDRVAVLREGVVDFDVGVARDFPEDIDRIELFRDRFVVLLREGHPALGRRLTVARFAALEHVLVAPRGTPRGVVDRLLEREGRRRRVARSVARFFVAPELVAESDYALTISARVAARVAPRLGLVARRPPIALSGYTISLSWHRRNTDDPGHRWMREQIAAVAAERGPLPAEPPLGPPRK